jgi:hypothetical protein
MLRKACLVVLAAVLCGLVAPRAASAGYHYGLEYGGGWGQGFVYDGPVYYPPLRRYPNNYPYEGYPYIGYDGPPFYLVWDDGYCYVMHRPGHRYVRARTVQSCD